uniref:Uncharacterized protein n=1 Tax=Tanacetum cinerariifolium TaxID=118510 RepID=A0A6L2N9B9_TANCI|nr:hypothetical protein [Tanacetum cinerariifolium]
MPIPKDLITDAIWNSDYYKKYLEMANHKPCQPTTMTSEEVKKKKEAPKAGKSKQPAPTKQPKHAKKKTSKHNCSKKINKGKRFDRLVDEEDEVEGRERRAPISSVAIRESNLVITQKLPDVEGKGRVTQDASTEPCTQPQDDTFANVVNDTLSLTDFTNDAETVADMEQSNSETGTEILNVEEEQGKEVSNTLALEEKTIKLDEGQDGSDPVYPKVHENLKLITKEQVHIKNPPSSSWTISSIKNLEEDFTFSDQFLNDKSTEEESRKANVETEVESMVTIPIHQASSSVPLLSTPIIDLSPPKPVSPLDKTTQALASRFYKLEHHDLYSKIDKQVNEVVKEAVHNALQAPLHERFKDLSEFQMKEILHDRMFESNSYRSHLDHTALYEALEPLVQKSSTWKTSDSREAPSSSSKQKPASLSKQSVNDDPILVDMHLSKLEDTGAANLPKIKNKLDWLKPLPEEETPKTPKPD